MYEFISNLKKAGEKYPDDLLFLVRFWNAHLMDSLLSYEAMEED